jgi:hypothetical protein
LASKTFDLIDGNWRLVRLEDQLGKVVSLRGRVRSLNGVWWFSYRGIDLYVDEMEQLPGWSPEIHGQAIEVEGRLERAQLPRLDQVSLKPDRDLADHYIVRGAELKPLPHLLSPDRPFPRAKTEQDSKANTP